MLFVLLKKIFFFILKNLSNSLIFILTEVSNSILFILNEVSNCLSFIINDIFNLFFIFFPRPYYDLNLEFNLLRMVDSEGEGWADDELEENTPKKDKGKGKASAEEIEQWEAEKKEALEAEKKEADKALKAEQDKASKSLADILAREEATSSLKRKASDIDYNKESVSKKQNTEDSSSKKLNEDSFRMKFQKEEVSSVVKTSYIRKDTLEENRDRADEFRKESQPKKRINLVYTHTVPTTLEQDKKWLEGEIHFEAQNIKALSKVMTEKWPQSSYVKQLRDAYNIDGYDTPNSESSPSSGEEDQLENINPNSPTDTNNSAFFFILFPSLGLINTAFVLVWFDKFKNKLLGENETERQKKIRALQILFLDVLARFVLVSVNMITMTILQYIFSFF